MKLAADFRREAREALSGKWKTAILIGILATILGATGNGFSMTGNGFSIEFEKIADAGYVGVSFAGTTLYSASISSADTIGMQNFVAGTVTYLPIYMCYLLKEQKINQMIVDLDIEGL